MILFREQIIVGYFLIFFKQHKIANICKNLKLNKWINVFKKIKEIDYRRYHNVKFK